MRPAKKAQEVVACPNCAKDVSPELSAPEFAFSHTPEGLGPQSTGVSGLDHDVDRIVGRDAERQWAAVAERKNRKNRILASNPDKDLEDLSRTFDDDYRVMTRAERRAAATAANLHHEAVDQIKQHTQGKNFLAKRLERSADS